MLRLKSASSFVLLATVSLSVALAAICLPAAASTWYSSTLNWPGGVIPYTFDTSAGSGVDAAQQIAFLGGAEEWELAGDIQFVPWTGQTQYLLVQSNTTGVEHFTMSSGQCTVSLFAWNREQVCHELGHILGLDHEMVRPDRNTYVNVLLSNIIPADQFFFDIASADITRSAYDFESVMHLSSTFDSIDPDTLYSMTPTAPYIAYQNLMGEGGPLSISDRAGMALAYGAGPVLSPVVTTTSDSGVGSLRAAIYYADDHPGATISFNIPKTDPNYKKGVFVISVTDHLPRVHTDGTIIDGSTEASFIGSKATTPLVAIDGSSAGALPGYISGFTIEASNCTIKDLNIRGFSYAGVDIVTSFSQDNTITKCWIGTDSTGKLADGNEHGVVVELGSTDNVIGPDNVLSGNTNLGVYLEGSDVSGNTVIGNKIGTNSGATAALPNGFQGILINQQSTKNVIGGTSTADRNIISGNAQYGVYISDPGTTGNKIEHNYIGLNGTGTAALPNPIAGVGIFGGATGNTVGGAAAASGNVISGNGGYGVIVSDPDTSGNLVEANKIGTDTTGTVAVPNQSGGILIGNGATTNTVGGTLASAARNVMSGNDGYGILVSDPGTSHNVIEGNYIGVDATGVKALGNTLSGAWITNGAASNTIGGASAAKGNVISGNDEYGLLVTAASTSSNKIEANIVGLGSDSKTTVGNSYAGIALWGGATKNMIGGTAASYGNVISANGWYGVVVYDTATVGNSIRCNSIFANTYVGIYLSGGNDLESSPVLTSATSTPTGTTIVGAVSTAPNKGVTIDLYASNVADPSGFGPGQFYIGSIKATTNAKGSASFTFTQSTALPAPIISATTTSNSVGDTSQFSADVTAGG